LRAAYQYFAFLGGVLNKRSVLVIAAHPDDEVLGCGGTIARHAQAGDEVHVVILAEGLTSRGSSRTDRHCYDDSLSLLAQSAEHASRVLGVASLNLYHFPDNRMDSIDRLEVVKMVETVVSQRQPEIVYTHHAGDVNIDHRVVHDAVVTACRPIPGRGIKTLLFFEIASSTEWQAPGLAPAFSPNWFIDISAALEKKMEALHAYHSEMRAWPHSRSIRAIEHLARWRGASAGMEAAEAFMLGRNLITAPHSVGN